MLFFSLRGNINEPVILKDMEGNPVSTLSVIPKENTSVDETGIYVSSIFDLRQLDYILKQKYKGEVTIQLFEEDVIADNFSLPHKVGVHLNKDGQVTHQSFDNAFEKFKEEEKKEARFLLANVFGNSYTDAFFASNLQREITDRFITQNVIVRYQGSVPVAFNQGMKVSTEVHPMNFYMNAVFPLSIYMQFDFAIDLSDLDIRKGYLTDNPQKFFAHQMGLGDAERNFGYSINKIRKIQLDNAVSSLRKDFSKVTMVQTNGSYQVNSMPEGLASDLINDLAAKNPEILFITDSLLESYPDNVTNMNKLVKSYSDYVYLCEISDSIVSVYSLAAVIASVCHTPAVILSTNADTKALITNDKVQKGLDIRDHQFVSPQLQLAQITKEQQEDIWKDIDFNSISDLYNEIKDCEINKHKLEEFVSGDVYLARANGI